MSYSMTHRIQRPTLQAVAKSHMRVRYNEDKKTWEVYTFLTGQPDKWKWFAITKDTAEWYREEFHAAVELYQGEQK